MKQEHSPLPWKLGTVNNHQKLLDACKAAIGCITPDVLKWPKGANVPLMLKEAIADAEKDL